MPGLFLVLEGIEGSGKSTQARLLADWLAENGVEYVLTREPGGTAAGEEIRGVLLHGHELNARAELLLMLAARAALVEQVIRPALARNAVVLADRFALSTLAYQAYGRELDLNEVRRLNAFATGGLEPDLTIVLEVPLEEGAARRRAAGKSPDRIESAGDAFHARVAEAYALLAATEGNAHRLDGGGTTAQVQARIRSHLSGVFPETFTLAGGLNPDPGRPAGGPTKAMEDG